MKKDCKDTDCAFNIKGKCTTTPFRVEDTDDGIIKTCNRFKLRGISKSGNSRFGDVFVTHCNETDF